jgi:hypothetical protein
MHTQAAMSDNQTPSSPKREEHLSKSLHHFTSAADLGDPQSAHNVGLRYLLRDEMVDEIGLGKEEDGRSDEDVITQAKSRHRSLWGVEANDVEARNWFQKAAELGECFPSFCPTSSWILRLLTRGENDDTGSIPAMMNYAGMLVEARGVTAPFLNSDGEKVTSQEDANRILIRARLEDLKKAESLYSRVAAHGSMMTQQQSKNTSTTSSESTNAEVDQASSSKGKDVGQEMANFAQEAIGTVQLMIKQLMEEANKVQGGDGGGRNNATA